MPDPIGARSSAMDASRPWRLPTARILLVGGLLIGLASWLATVGHVGDPHYLLRPGFSMFGYYLPFWIGGPFLPALAELKLREPGHAGMTRLSLLALFVGRPVFFARARKARS